MIEQVSEEVKKYIQKPKFFKSVPKTMKSAWKN